jgi:uncharacterized protein
MLLSEGDIKRIERLGYDKKQFVRTDRSGYLKLRNTQNHCLFYKMDTKECKIYDSRPEGCRIYPVLFDSAVGIAVDRLCTARSTLNWQEQAETGLKLNDLLNRIDKEAQHRIKRKSRRAKVGT